MGEDDASGNKQHANPRNLGLQPLDDIMRHSGWANHDIVAASTEPLTHKAVQRARQGRWLTPQTQRRVLAAVNLLSVGRPKPYALADVFNYDASLRSSATDEMPPAP
jgi:hypothetical protein